MINSKNFFYKVLIGQYSTEKAVILSDKFNSITFQVLKTSNKYDIKNSVQNLFNVRVKSVKIINVKGKLVKFKGRNGKRKDWKKAIVVLKKGYDINFSEFK